MRLVERVRLSTPSLGDTRRIALFGRIWETLRKSAGNHVHDDFARHGQHRRRIVAGADVISSNINGVGRRSGKPPNEEVVFAPADAFGVDLGVDTSLLVETCHSFRDCRRSHPCLRRSWGQNASPSIGHAVAGMRNMVFYVRAFAPSWWAKTPHRAGQKERKGLHRAEARRDGRRLPP